MNTIILDSLVATILDSSVATFEKSDALLLLS